MLDIIDRLRGTALEGEVSSFILNDAADEIERLRDLVAKRADICGQLIGENERLLDGIQRVIDGTYGRDKYFKTKHDTCPHGRFSWQFCEPCVDEYLSSLVSASQSETP
jgi:hypothetical protein